MSAAVHIKNLSKNFKKKQVFSNISVTIPAGRVVGLLGENGVGKTTLLRLMADILKPNEGEIVIGGVPVSIKTRSQVSFMPAAENFYSFMNGKDAIEYFHDFYPDFDRDRATALCTEFDLDLKAKIKMMSRGQQERLCIVLCLCRRVPLYILDEPIIGLDLKFKHESIKTMLANTDEHQTMIISSHLLKDLETIFDQIIILKKDAVIQMDCDDIRAMGKSIESYYLEAVQ